MRTLLCITAVSAVLLACTHSTAIATETEGTAEVAADTAVWPAQRALPQPQSPLSGKRAPSPLLSPPHGNKQAPASTPPFSAKEQTFQLQHILAHGAPRSKFSKTFRRLAVDHKMRLEMAQQRSQGQNVWNGMDLYDEGHPESVFEHSLSDTRFPLHSTNDDNNKNSVENGRHLNLHSRKLDPLPTSQRVPDARDHKTVVSMVRMALDAYVDPKEQGWVDIGDGWEVGASFGWLESGLRGYIFVSEDQTTVVVGIKGTSLQLFGTGGGPTANNDKLNDNQMFSCCCGKTDSTWWSMCGCSLGGNQCSQQCLADDLKKDRDQGESYYDMGLKLIETTKTLYPKASIWLTGHSLGGSVASMIGITKGYPTFTFSAPGDVRFAQRLGIVPHKLSKHKLASQPVWQFGQTADPIFMGTCNGPTSICNSAGFIVETKCHLGNTCIYDTIEGLGWSQNIQAHALSTFISMVEDWGNMTNGSAKVPTCAPQADCQDCTQWEYV